MADRLKLKIRTKISDRICGADSGRTIDDPQTGDPVILLTSGHHRFMAQLIVVTSTAQLLQLNWTVRSAVCG